MAVNKVVMNTENGSETLIDLTGDTVTPATLAKGVTAHDASGTVIVGTMNADIIPEYWQTALDEGVDAINTAICNAGANKSAFLMYSDAHWWEKARTEVADASQSYTAKMEPALLKYLHKNTYITKTIFGGDFIGEEADITTEAGKAKMAYIQEWRSAIKDLPNHHSVVGNHDDGNEVNNRFTEKYVYGYLLAPEESPDVVRGVDGMYYYIDQTPEKTRYLYLDTAYKGMTTEQQEFIKEALISTPEGWHIVVIAHTWYYPDYDQYSVRPIPVKGLDNNAVAVITMLDAYNSRTGDYENCGGWVEFCIGGHVHRDYDGVTSTGIPILLIEASGLNDRSGLPCNIGTTTETAISAIVADYDAKKINVIRIGRGESREVVVTNKVVNYTNVIPLSVGSDGQPFNGGKGWCDNSRIGSGGIYMGNQTGDAAQWVTGYIEFDPNADVTIRLKNITFDRNSTSTHHGVGFFDASFARCTAIENSFNWLANGHLSGSAYSPVYDANGNFTQFTIPKSKITNTNVKYFALCCGGISDDSIITINEPIE